MAICRKFSNETRQISKSFHQVSTMLVYAIISITLALVFYTIGVWGEKWNRALRTWHVVVFWLGFVFDTIGTTLMSKISAGRFEFNLHGMTGLAAIILMLFHAVWASVVLLRNNERAKVNFHKLSIFVWLIWLIPYISGAISGMSGD